MFLLTKYRELKNGAYDLPGMPWKDALLIAWAHDCIGLKIKLGGEWPMVTGGAPWVKHPTDFRNSATAVSARGVGGVKVELALYKLREVIGEFCTEENDFSTELFLEPPHDLYWLARQIIGEEFDEDLGANRQSTDRECEEILKMLSAAGSVRLSRRASSTWRDKKTNERVEYYVIECPGLEKSLKRYERTAQRRKGDG